MTTDMLRVLHGQFQVAEIENENESKIPRFLAESETEKGMW